LTARLQTVAAVVVATDDVVKEAVVDAVVGVKDDVLEPLPGEVPGQVGSLTTSEIWLRISQVGSVKWPANAAA
jgi:hypothetical protein